MQRYLLYLLCLLAFHCVEAQRTDFDQIVIPEGQPPRNFEDCLVQLAWLNSPGNTVMRHRVNITDFEVEKSKREWLEDILLTFNLNESHFGRKDSLSNNIFFPRYNLGATFNLGKFINRKYDIGRSKEEKMIAELEENQQKLEVRGEVLYRYEKLKLAEEIEEIRLQAKQDAEEVYFLATEQFKKDKIDFQDYNNSIERYHNAQAEHFRAKSEVNQSILSLEQLIGVDWDKVLPKREVMEKRERSRGK